VFAGGFFETEPERTTPRGCKVTGCISMAEQQRGKQILSNREVEELGASFLVCFWSEKDYLVGLWRQEVV